MGMVEPIHIALVKRGNISESESARPIGVGLRLAISYIDPQTGEKG